MFLCKPNDSCFSPRLNSDSGGDVYIQMVTALVLQLIQCVVHFPEKDGDDDHNKKVTTADLENTKTIFFRNYAFIQK